MSHTRRRLPFVGRGDKYRFFRNPRRNNAEKGTVRNGAIPPSAWDDIPIQEDVMLAYKLINRLLDQGINDSDIAETLTKKFKVSIGEALCQIVSVKTWR